MRVYLVQHGKPKPEEEDPRKPLSEEGKKDVVFTAEIALHALKRDKPRIFHSGKLRARETAEIIGRMIGVEPGEGESLSPLDDPGIWLEKLEKTSENVMLVGHLPHLEKLAGLLLSKDGIVKFEMGCIVCLEKGEKGWFLKWMITPSLKG